MCLLHVKVNQKQLCITLQLESRHNSEAYKLCMLHGCLRPQCTVQLDSISSLPTFKKKMSAHCMQG